MKLITVNFENIQDDSKLKSIQSVKDVTSQNSTNFSNVSKGAKISSIQKLDLLEKYPEVFDGEGTLPGKLKTRSG